LKKERKMKVVIDPAERVFLDEELSRRSTKWSAAWRKAMDREFTRVEVRWCLLLERLEEMENVDSELLVEVKHALDCWIEVAARLSLNVGYHLAVQDVCPKEPVVAVVLGLENEHVDFRILADELTDVEMESVKRTVDSFAERPSKACDQVF
jgi:hypothetical protein